jgi:Flp pilus assembly pilin Flp
MQTFLIKILKFARARDGQDLVEYTLLVGFIVLASAALFQGSGGSVSTIWGQANAYLSGATQNQSNTTTSGTTPPPPPPGLVDACNMNNGHLVYTGVGDAYSCQ